MKLLVTGGAGFIGSNFIRYMLSKYPAYSVVNLDFLTYGGDRSSLAEWEGNDRYLFVQGDICDKEVVYPLVEGCNMIVHFAAESHVDRSIADPLPFIRTNVLGTGVLLEAARTYDNKRFHHISTDEVFGQLSADEAPFCETTPYDPRSPYSASKAASDHLVRAYFHTHGLPVTISNCSNNYGPYQHPEKLIPRAITNLIENTKVPVYGTGENIRDWLYVEDHCKAIDRIIHDGRIGETYCIGGGAEKKNIETIRGLLSIIGKGEEYIEFVGDRLGHDLRYAISYSKIEDELGWKPETDFETGLQKTVAWYKNNESWWKIKK